MPLHSVEGLAPESHPIRCVRSVMPRTCRHLFERVVALPILIEAYKKARRGKRVRDYVYAFDRRREENLVGLIGHPLDPHRLHLHHYRPARREGLGRVRCRLRSPPRLGNLDLEIEMISRRLTFDRGFVILCTIVLCTHKLALLVGYQDG